MKTKNTQQEIAMIKAIKRSNKTDLSECYKTYSVFKSRACYSIKKDCEALNGKNFRITSYNGWCFSCGFFYTDKQTGVLRCRYETREKRYDFEVFEQM